MKHPLADIANVAIVIDTAIESVTNYNDRTQSRHMKFQNNDGSLKKVGYVATYMGQSNYFRTEKLAIAFAENPSYTEDTTTSHDDQLGA